MTKAVALAISAVWAISELALARVRNSARSGAAPRDRASLYVILAAMAAAIPAAIWASRARLGTLPGDPRAWDIAGAALIVAGFLIRVHAIRTLGRFFTVDVSIARDHRLVETGLYRRVRHPAYLGTLVSFAGLGLAFGSWTSVALLLVPIGAAFVHRMRVEERALEDALGEPYRAYRERSKRLVPGVY